ncbi:MAG: bifunctional 5,10-methylenetetrahydrofolate dehydrogenase/5,10-methenyltetrahydrofolate cyclohydrolase, partial [Candidatus Omnitrophica bacterium]|nr:bifunctional 5,10-methylenetetrahydrofolate dehydrogenase/5,10-methenyltetrahydrofolate cyclohydrolase [Candidatus Omnitrophota bacterium]
AYARSQQKVAEYIGISYELETLPANITQKDLVAFVKKLDAEGSVHGVMLHKPVPAHIDYRAVGNQISPVKDMEGVNVVNIGKMILGDTRIIPCTPAAVMEHIRSTGVNLRGKEAVVVGHSEIVGKPLSMLLLAENATVTVCHVATSEAGKLTEHIGRADVLVVAVGKPALVKGDWIKHGAVVIDVGINKLDSGIVGDVEFEPAKKRASFITPVPGGVGPVTVVMLMRNGIETFKAQHEAKKVLI